MIHEYQIKYKRTLTIVIFTSYDVLSIKKKEVNWFKIEMTAMNEVEVWNKCVHTGRNSRVFHTHCAHFLRFYLLQAYD